MPLPARVAPSLAALSSEQRAIVEQLDGAVLALAPAGTGKTTVLTERVARALDAGIPPERILCVTFTNRAARELRTRIASRFPDLVTRLAPRTFHQLCADIVRREAKRVGLPVEFAVCPDHDSIAMLKRILASPEDDDKEAQQIYRRLQDVKTHWQTADLRWPIGQAWARAGFGEARHQEAARKYERGLSQWQRIDFADLVLYVRAFFAAIPEIRERWASRYDLVQVDEIQDTHLSEYEVVATLAGRSRNLALFGDLDQTIYEWRGATPDRLMARFRREFGGVLEVGLTDNHRATRALIHAADAFAGTLRQRVTRLTAAPSLPDGEPVQEHVAESVSGEAGWIAERVKTLSTRDGVPLPSIGVLAPTNWYCEEIAGALARRGVPHVTAARMLFFRRPEVGDALAYLKLILNPEAPGEALRVWECSTRGIGHEVLRRIARDGQPVGLRLVDFFQLGTFVHGDPLAPLLDAHDRGRVVVFDLETTGLDERRDEIVEIAAMRLEAGRRSASYTALVRPSIPVGESVGVHGLSDAKLAAEGRPPEEAIGRLLKATEGALLVGHNVAFDIRMLAAQAGRLGLTFAPTASFDTLDLARRFHPQEPHTLAALSVSLRLAHRPSHRAADDVATTVDLLAWTVDRATRGQAERQRIIRECGADFEVLARQLDGWRALLPTTRPATLLQRVLAESGLRERVASEPARRHALDELIRIFEAEDDLDEAPTAALRSALERAALATQVDLLATAEQRVPVLTIHQAKGLEFDIVFVAGCADGDLPRRRAVADRRDEEERRLFYVALTRARRQLILSRPAYSNAGRPKAPSPFLAALRGSLTPALE
ncbi:MAG: UvrD-helicase domain-containing protein [Chloroflexi bacterium]|nr:UvrD-helicase domain-containing protein [Chloroflexota bacterium]